MPDTRLPPVTPTPPPEDWQQALSALPLETPPPGGWERLAPRLQKRRSTARYWVPAALAASLAVLMVLPWKTRDPESVSTPTVATTTQPDVRATPATNPSPAQVRPTDDPVSTEAPDTRVATDTPASATDQESIALPAKRPQAGEIRRRAAAAGEPGADAGGH